MDQQTKSALPSAEPATGIATKSFSSIVGRTTHENPADMRNMDAAATTEATTCCRRDACGRMRLSSKPTLTEMPPTSTAVGMANAREYPMNLANESCPERPATRTAITIPSEPLNSTPASRTAPGFHVKHFELLLMSEALIDRGLACPLRRSSTSDRRAWFAAQVGSCFIRHEGGSHIHHKVKYVVNSSI